MVRYPPNGFTRFLCVLLVLAGGLLMATAGADTPPANGGFVAQINLDDAIGPATAAYVHDAGKRAVDDGASAIILRLDTPGGLSKSMRGIIDDILASPVPVLGYVAPRGARAASAGTYILYACHIAAMAPTTHLGAATPVTLGGSPPTRPPQDGNNKDTEHDGSGEHEQPRDLSSQASERRKIINDAVAYIRSLAEQRDRNADWAEAAVRSAVSLTASQALKKNVIDLIADNRADLLLQLDVRQVQTGAGEHTPHTRSERIVHAPPGWRTELLGIITQPTLAYLLLMIGIFGLLLEGFNPGVVLPGVIGGTCLLAALYAFQILPVNYAGLGLIVLGLCLLISEAFVPSFGALGLGGIAAFAFGSIMLMNSDVPGFEIPLGLILGLSIGAALLILLVIIMFARARRRRVHTGYRGLIGSHCRAMADFDAEGRVWLHGESWRARCTQPVSKGDELVVMSVSELTVEVRPVESSPASATDA